MKQGKQGVYARYIKRILDVLLSGCALIVLSPVLLIVAVLVRTSGPAEGYSPGFLPRLFIAAFTYIGIL